MKKKRSILIFILIVAFVLLACALPLPGSGQSEGGDQTEAEESQASEVEEVEEAEEIEEAETEEGEEAEEVESEEAEDVSEESYDINDAKPKLKEFILRPEDLPNDYRVPSGGERRFNNEGLINQIGELEAKEYIVATGRVDGWRIELERVNKEDIAPGRFESEVELFETNEGARTALTPEWFKAYQEDYVESTWIEDGCDIGDKCIFYYHEKYDDAAGLTTVTYEVAFVHRNLLVWILARGLDVDMSQDYVLDVAQSVYDKISRYD
jgi:hypothetical protein